MALLVGSRSGSGVFNRIRRWCYRGQRKAFDGRKGSDDSQDKQKRRKQYTDHYSSVLQREPYRVPENGTDGFSEYCGVGGIGRRRACHPEFLYME